MKFAHLTKVKTGYQLRITDSNRPIGGILILCDNKRLARAIAKSQNAQAWNF